MVDDKLSILIGMPQGYWKFFDAETTQTGVIETKGDPERYTEILSRAYVELVIDFGIAPEILNRGSRLPWVHSIRAGTKDLLTPEPIAVEHVAFTGHKAPHAKSTQKSGKPSVGKEFPGNQLSCIDPDAPQYDSYFKRGSDRREPG